MRNLNPVLYRAEKNPLTSSTKPRGQNQLITERLNERGQIRQINEFSFSYDRKKRKGIFLALVLICFSIICLGLFALGVNVTVFFSAGALIIFIQLIKSGYDFSQEEIRTRFAYHNYLDTFSYHALFTLSRTSELSAWTKYEIDQYLELFS